jgi:hypothetical protein
LQAEKPSDINLAASAASAAAPVAVSPARTALAVLAALVLPGLGHGVLGRWGRGLVVGLSLAAMFALGLLMQGRLFTPVPGEWLTWIYSALDVGIGLPYFLCLASDFGFAINAAAPTYEYGNTFLAVAGALNLLAAMDAFDIAIGRKS